jgi:hypothetical protein
MLAGVLTRRLLAAVLVTALALAGAGVRSRSWRPKPADPVAASSARIERELPRGGRTIFPRYRLVGFCGTPGAPALGRLTGELGQASEALVAYASSYAAPDGREILPVFELIAVVVQGAPGDDRMWRRRVDGAVVDEYLRAARKAKGLLLLDLQPGRSDFLTEAKHFERWLREPDVGVALDPEWAVKGDNRPAEEFGHTSGEEIDAVAAYLSALVAGGGLPEKALVYHQVTGSVVRDGGAITLRPGVAIVQSVDGLGPKAAKLKTYGILSEDKPEAAHSGIKLFFDEDTRAGGKLMSPAEVLALEPRPEYVMVE